MWMTANAVRAAASRPVQRPYIRRPMANTRNTDAVSARAASVRPANRMSIAPQSVNSSATERISTSP